MHSYVPFHGRWTGRSNPDDLGQSLPFPTFYARIAAGATPTTSQVNVEEFKAFFTPFLEAGQDILHLSLSSGLSGAWQSACIARDELEARFPERRIRVVDSLGASSGYGLLLDAAWERRKAGAGLDQLADWLEALKLEVQHWCFSTDLTSYKSGAPHLSHSGGSGDSAGHLPSAEQGPSGRLLTCPRKRSAARAVHPAHVQKMADARPRRRSLLRQVAFLCHSACSEDARAVADLVEARFPSLDGRVVINSVGTVIGAHTGPGTVALFFWGDKRTD
jgi:DegV family protein with EDD domain